MDIPPQLNSFNGDAWKFKALEDYSSYKAFHDFATNLSALQAYEESFQYYAAIPEIHPHGTEKLLRGHKRDDVERALNHYGAQTIVSLCTCYEVAIRNFFECVFIAYPDRLFDFIGPESAKGHVSLRDITIHKSRDELLIELSRRGAAVASKGDYGKSLLRASNLVRSGLDIETAALAALQKTRNVIVHEAAHPMALPSITDAHDTVDSAIESLCKIGLATGIPGRYSCIDQSNTIVMQSVALLGKE
jgi:hypothetical protein